MKVKQYLREVYFCLVPSTDAFWCVSWYLTSSPLIIVDRVGDCFSQSIGYNPSTFIIMKLLMGLDTWNQNNFISVEINNSYFGVFMKSSRWSGCINMELDYIRSYETDIHLSVSHHIFSMEWSRAGPRKVGLTSIVWFLPRFLYLILSKSSSPPHRHPFFFLLGVSSEAIYGKWLWKAVNK